MSLEKLRIDLTEVDLEIINLLKKRFDICKKIAIEKKSLNLPVKNLMEKDKKWQLYGEHLNSYGMKIYTAIHTESVKFQNEL